MDAARLISRLVRNVDFACRQDDGSILAVFTDTDLRHAHVVARRLASVLKHTMLRPGNEQTPISPNVTLASMKPSDTVLTLMARVAPRPVAAEVRRLKSGEHQPARPAMPETAKPQEPLRIDVVSDVVCPWCFIGKRRLEKALALKPDVPVEVHYHPYFLNPWVPREGMARDEYLTTKFGSPERYKGIAGRVAAAAAEEGLTYAVEKMTRQPNTTDSHRLILWAAGIGKASQMKQRLMEMYFTEGADLSDREVLVKAAAEIGLNAEEVRGKLASDADLEQVEQAANSAKDAGIDGVPTFILGGVAAISGAQSPEVLANAIEQVANNREKFVAEARARQAAPV